MGAVDPDEDVCRVLVSREGGRRGECACDDPTGGRKRSKRAVAWLETTTPWTESDTDAGPARPEMDARECVCHGMEGPAGEGWQMWGGKRPAGSTTEEE
jgi:hypothetical protein